ncbi:hypothetical protein HX001_06695 [Empedobacter brevis]|uniref:Lipoprotein n=2 Tax=Empedobacter brevis TaxID=247 RepID=A0A511NII3_9FLAO|nr:hypothetical protein [Empedobacter brevis]MDM1072183.1 hypothetical protein [Empedobacter brevis]QES92113.1 hypothetical protein F0358_04975 [Empedobacter brevis]QHC83901.1 hypothetical protein AS589_03380 [Empedobacter brevis]GEM52623.1 hypothetical protein EB1_24130 [Empedobacter brevis NBRC 14943 = ATCC 43319]
MKASALLMVGVILALTACKKKSDLPDYKVKEAVLDVYKYRADKPDSLFAKVEGVEVDNLNAPIKQYGPVDVYNFEKMTPLEDGDKTVYEAVYKVSFKGAEGTETFKVRRVDKMDGIVVGYSNDIKPVAMTDSTAVKKDTVAEKK